MLRRRQKSVVKTTKVEQRELERSSIIQPKQKSQRKSKGSDYCPLQNETTSVALKQKRGTENVDQTENVNQQAGSMSSKENNLTADKTTSVGKKTSIKEKHKARSGKQTKTNHDKGKKQAHRKQIPCTQETADVRDFEKISELERTGDLTKIKKKEHSLVIGKKETQVKSPKVSNSEKEKMGKKRKKSSSEEKESKTEVRVKKNETKATKPEKFVKDSKTVKSDIEDNKKHPVYNKETLKLHSDALDEIDGDKETSAYFSGDSAKLNLSSNRQRKRKPAVEKKSMSSKVKHLKISSPKEISAQVVKVEDTDSSDSDFEDVPDMRSQSHKETKTMVTNKKSEEVEFATTQLTLEAVKDSKLDKNLAEERYISKQENASKVNKEDLKKSYRKRKSSDVTDAACEKSSKKIRKEKKTTAVKLPENSVVIKAEGHDKSKSSMRSKTTKKNGKEDKKAEDSKKVKTKKKKQENLQTQSHMETLKLVDHTDVTALLMHMEGPGMVAKPSTSYAIDEEAMISDDDSDDDNNDSDESEGDWEDVEDHHGHSPVKSQLPDKPVEITLEAPVIYKKRKKREFDIKAYFQRQINKYKRELNISMHKVHLLCLLARGFYINNLCSDETLQAQAMSISMTTRELKLATVKSCDATGLSYIITWLKGAFPLKTSGEEQSIDLRKRLEKSFQERSVTSRLEFVLVCVILLRQLGYPTRLVMSLQPIAVRTAGKKDPSSGKKQSGNPARIRKILKETDEIENKKETKGAQSSGKTKLPEKLKIRSANKTENEKGNSKRTRIDINDSQGNKQEVKGATNKKDIVADKTVKTGKKGKEKSISKPKIDNDVDSDCENEINNNRLKAKNKSRRSCASKIRPNTYVDNDDEVEDSEDEFVPVENNDNDDDTDDDSGSDLPDQEKNLKKDVKKKGKVKEEEKESSDNDFADESFQLRTQALKKVTPTRKNKKALSSDSGETVDSRTGADEWVEVFLQKEQKWICIDCVTGKLNKPYSVEHNATPPVHYVVGFFEDDTAKDVTARYASQWLTNTRKFRADEEWWEETMDLYKPLDTEMEEQEDREIQSHLLQRPLPTVIGAFKNHPLYALKRHLLKFEAIYPETAVPLGYIRGEPVYARECVHVLHSRENWLKEGRAVRVGEEPYKHVKSRPKWNKPKENPDALDLEVFGRWQTEVYIPPPAVDGKVPRNAHGNVEMFLPSMLPAGTVHIQIPGLNKVAKKLDIDCAPAMVGWDHHCGFSHPQMDGWIVCEEFKDILLAAWDEEQEIQREKEQEKREKRVYSNWKLLIKGMLIKERLKKRFDLEEEEKSTSKETTATDVKESEKGEKAADYTKSWPQNRQTQKQTHFDVEKL